MALVISIFSRAIVLQADGPTECINNTMFRVDSPTKPILAVFSPTNHWSCSTVRLLIRWSRPVDRKSYCLQDYQYTSRDQCVVSPTFCRNIDTLVETVVSLVLLSILLLIEHSRALCRQFYILQRYRYPSQDQCVVSGSEMREFFIFKTFHVLYRHMEAHPWCLVQGPEIYLIQKSSRLATKISQNNIKN